MFNTIFLCFETTIIGCFNTSPNIFLRDVIKENEIGRVRGTHGEESKKMEGCGGKTRSKEKFWKTSA
jgi:hypothetical protein